MSVLVMKRSLVLVILLLALSGARTALGQCELNLVGTWKTVGGDYDQQLLYRFSADGQFTILPAVSVADSKSNVLATGKYELDDPRSPKVISINSPTKTPLFASGKT